MNRQRTLCWRLNSFISDPGVNRYVLLSHWPFDNVSQESKLGSINFDGENLINGQYTRIHSSPLQAENVSKVIPKRDFSPRFSWQLFLCYFVCLFLLLLLLLFFAFHNFSLHGFSCPSETLNRRVWSSPYSNEKLPVNKGPLNFYLQENN